MNKEDELLLKRLKELANQADTRYYTTVSDFLNLNELNLFLNNLKEFPPVPYKLWGGYEDADRKRIAFYQDEDNLPAEFGITLVKISPLNAKFADSLTHRDFLGALVNLGIDRSKLGDILIKNNCGYLFSDDKISTYIVDTLTKIKHTNVSCEITECSTLDVKPTFMEIKGSVSSLRIDAILALAMKSSRSTVSSLILGGKVFINSRLVLQNSYTVKENDIISVRGYGKFIYSGITNQTKKGRFYVIILRYI